jgi:hypothetical protein
MSVQATRLQAQTRPISQSQGSRASTVTLGSIQRRDPASFSSAAAKDEIANC